MLNSIYHQWRVVLRWWRLFGLFNTFVPESDTSFGPRFGLWQAKVPEMAQRVFRRFMKMDPDMVEDYIEYLAAHGQWNEAATLLAHALNRESFQSKKVSFPAPGRPCLFGIWDSCDPARL